MTLSHDEANARLLELVYGEAAPVERAAIEAHVATCPRCTADLAALGDTRARVRTALDDEDAPVPARAHARILEAAAAAVAPAVAAPARAVAPSSGLSFWERLRATWTFPTLATVGAVAVVVLASKVFLDPERTMERGREVAGASPPPVAAPAALPVGEGATEAEKSLAKSEPLRDDRAAPPPPSAAAPSDEVHPTSARHFDPGAVAGAAAEAVKRSHPSGANKPPGLLDASSSAQRYVRGHGTGAGGGLDNLGGVGSVGGVGSARGAGTAPAERKSPSPDDDVLQGAERRPSKVASKAEAPAETSRGGYASPPSGWKGGAAPPPASAPAARSQPAPATHKAEKRAVADSPVDSEDLGAAAPPPEAQRLRQEAPLEEESASAPQPLAKKKSAPAAESKPPAAPPPPVVAAEAEGARDKSPAPAAATAPAAAPAKSVAADKAVDKDRKQDDATSQEALTRRADQLFAARRWAEAIAAYRELLRRYPDAELKTRWRARITQAEAEADSTATAAKAAKAEKAPAKAETKSKATLDAEPAAK